MTHQDKTLVLRHVTIKDEKILFEWVNDPLVRQGSFNQQTVSLSEHKIWFRELLESQKKFMWILEYSNIPCGMVRIEKKNQEFKLSYSIAASHRGKNLASIMIKTAMEQFCTASPGEKVFAYTRSDNIASCKSLERSGFQLEHTSLNKNTFVYMCTETS